jgi:hypothetical protein
LEPGGFKLWVNWIRPVQPPPPTMRLVNLRRPSASLGWWNLHAAP